MLDEKVKTVAVISGKGGVGKTTVAIGLAMAMRDAGHRVGLLDVDIESSSLGDALGLNYDSLRMGESIEPAEVLGLKVMSLAMFLASEWEDAPTLLKEDRVTHLIDQLFVSVNWGEIDVLVIDTPPGTGPELRALARKRLSGFLLVAAVQRLSELPVRRLIRMAREEYHLPILGVVSNNPYNVSLDAEAQGTAERLFARYELPILASLSWEPQIATAMDAQIRLPLELFASMADAVAAALFGEKRGRRTLEAVALRREGKTRRQIAETMGLTVGRVGQLLAQARKVGLLQ